MRERFFWGTLYGVAYMGILSIGVFVALPDNVWPTPMGWVKLGVILFGSFCLGIFTYMRDPERAWKSHPTLSNRRDII